MSNFLECVIQAFESEKALADKAIAQCDDDTLFAKPTDESNSIAIIIKHMAGNMHSRWTDFLTTDGEKPARNRDFEFLIKKQDSSEHLKNYWERGWICLFTALNALGPDDLDKTIYIRGEPHSVIKAILRQLAHYSYHVGQIVFLARHFTGAEWQTLSIAKGKSQAFNKSMMGKAT